MPNADTFSVPPIAAFVQRHVTGRSVDPFARNSTIATITNDLNPATRAQFHMEAVAFLEALPYLDGGLFDCAIIDPPYSPRQISECYSAAGLTAGMKETQNARLYSEVRKALLPLLKPNAKVLTFGWSTNGMGKKHGFEIEEIMLVAHGGAHNDTICMCEVRR